MSDDEEAKYGLHFGRADLYRVGFFDDTPPGPFDKYITGGVPKSVLQRSGQARGPQMLCSQKGRLFEKKFERIFVGEVLLGPPKSKKKRGKKQNILDVGDLKPPDGPKYHSCPGDWYGCIGKQPSHFSPETIPPPVVQSIPPNFRTSPNPVGGPGYLKICINPYLPMYKGREPYDPEYQHKEQDSCKRFVSMCNPLQYFDDNPYRQVNVRRTVEPPKPIKPPVREPFHVYFPEPTKGPFNGCLNSFPRYVADPCDVKRRKKGWHKRPLQPPGGPNLRTKFTVSIVELVTNISCNSQNYKEYAERVYPLS